MGINPPSDPEYWGGIQAPRPVENGEGGSRAPDPVENGEGFRAPDPWKMGRRDPGPLTPGKEGGGFQGP